MPGASPGGSPAGKCRERRRYGDIYVYERVTAYNPQTRKTVTVSERLKGKIKAGCTEIVPTRPKRKPGEAPKTATRQRTGTAEILQWGRLFTQFIALGYLCFLQKRLKEVRASLARDAASMTKEQFNLETKLARWLDEHSLAQILDWFDCIETTSVKTAAGVLRWSTESVARDRLLLQRLGVSIES